MMYVLQHTWTWGGSVYAGGYENLSTVIGRGRFNEDAIVAMHDKDARFGFVKVLPSDPAWTSAVGVFNGHAVDSVLFKNDDGVTAELYYVMVQSGFNWFNTQIVNGPPDISSWPQTAKITDIHVDEPTKAVFLSHTKQTGAGKWLPVSLAGTAGIQWTWWLFLSVGTGWVGSGFVPMWEGRLSTTNDYAKDWYNDSRWDPMPSHGPVKYGEYIAFCATSGNARDSKGSYGARERSDVIVFPSITDTHVVSLLEVSGFVIQWIFAGRDAANLARWKYPAV